jgi:hypothetical protein
LNEAEIAYAIVIFLCCRVIVGKLQTMSSPVSPSLKDLPKVNLDLKSELEGFKTVNMKKAETQEKNVLPTAEGMH